MTHALDSRADTTPYGDVTYADPGYQSDGVKRYPLDSEAHCRAAWSYINMPRNAAMYSADQLAAIKKRIMAAGKKYGIDFSAGRSASVEFLDSRAQMTAQAINDLPDSDFAYIEPGGSKDSEGKTVPRSLRHFPIHDAAHVRNALARAPQSPLGAKAMAAIKAAAKRFGIAVAGDNANSAEPVGEHRAGLAWCVRAFDFESRSSGDGRTLEGYAAVFNTPARIRAQGGDFDEVIFPGAFRSSLEKRTPVMQWEHGQDPRVGRIPIAAIDALSEDSTGLHVRARLYDNPVVEPIRQAIAGGSVNGMSFRFNVPDGGDNWPTRDQREIRNADVHELGPVVFPAYDATTVSVRSILAALPAEDRAALVRELADEVRLAVDLEDLTGRSDAWSQDGGDSGWEPEEENAPPATPDPFSVIAIQQRLDSGALQIRGILK